jgi:hypothetical protein
MPSQQRWFAKSPPVRDNIAMNAAGINKSGDLAELQEAVDRKLRAVRDPAAMRRAAERMDRMRESLPKTSVAVELIRAGRDEE